MKIRVAIATPRITLYNLDDTKPLATMQVALYHRDYAPILFSTNNKCYLVLTTKVFFF